MPISRLLLTCEPGRLDEVRRQVVARPHSEARESGGNALIVVTETATLDEDRAEVEALGKVGGVVAVHVVFTNIEDLAAAAAG